MYENFGQTQRLFRTDSQKIFMADSFMVEPPKNSTRLKALRSRAGLTVRGMAKALDVASSTYQHYESGYKKEFLPMELVQDLKRILAGKGTPPIRPQDIDALGGPIGEAHIGNSPDLPPEFEENTVKQPELGEDKTYVLELAVRGSAGGGGMIEGEPEWGTWLFPPDWLRSELKADASDIRIITIDGDSMEGVLRSGDKVLVHVGRVDPSPPGTFILFDGIGLVAKSLEFLDGSDPPTVRISSSNPRYPAYERTIDEINIVGRVVGRWERL